MSRPSPKWYTLRFENGFLSLLDQRLLPGREHYLRLQSAEAVARAIESMAIRGAPAIGCAAACGIAIAASSATDADHQRQQLENAFTRLAKTRPTAVNLFWALGRMREAWRNAKGTPREIARTLADEAHSILVDDVATCRAIGRAGLPLVPDGARILTHCNAGALATAAYGTALGVVRAAVEAGRGVEVLADETRPFLQGARLTAWELSRDNIPVTVIADSMAGEFLRRGEVDLVVVGADRVARNGDVANKIGTYSLAVLARAHGVPFYVAAPLSTIDLETASGAEIPLEERSREEMAQIGGNTILPEGVPVRHPAFDVTPAELVTALVTEAGIAEAPLAAGIAGLFERAKPPVAARASAGDTPSAAKIDLRRTPS